MFYQHSNFSFSKEACDWALAQYSSKLNTKVAHVLDIIPKDSSLQQCWSNSLIGQELNEFLSNYNLDINQYGINLLISNDDRTWYHPHIDFMFNGNKFVGVKSRFNVMILGTPNDEMVWWPDWASDDPRITYSEYKDINNNTFKMPGIPGNTTEERWDILGTPKIKTTNLYQNNTSAFVKTDCAHAVHVSPGLRFLTTVGFDKSLEEIFS